MALEDDSSRSDPATSGGEASDGAHPLLGHPLASQFLTSVEHWIRRESLGGDASVERAEMRDLAIRMMGLQNG
jgi:hypothetical protein